MNTDDSHTWVGSTTRRNLTKVVAAGLGIVVTGGIGTIAGSRPVAAVTDMNAFNADDVIINDDITQIDTVTVKPTFGDPGDYSNNPGLSWKNFSKGVQKISLEISVWTENDPLASATLYNIDDLTNYGEEIDIIDFNGHDTQRQSGKAAFELVQKDIIADTGSEISQSDFPQNVSDGESDDTTVTLDVAIEIHGEGDNAKVTNQESFAVGIDNPTTDGGTDGDANTDATGS